MVWGCVLVYCSMEGGDPLQFCEHGIHLILVDVVMQPGNPVARDVLTEFINETLCPLAVAEVLIQFGVAVDRLIVADPQCSVPSFVSCPTVHAVSFVVYF